MDVSKGVFKVGVTDGQVEILDSEMPVCECEFSIQGWYHSSPYSQVTAWMPWRKTSKPAKVIRLRAKRSSYDIHFYRPSTCPDGDQ